MIILREGNGSEKMGNFGEKTALKRSVIYRKNGTETVGNLREETALKRWEILGEKRY